MKELKNMTFEELVDESAGRILRELIAGNFRSAVYTSMDLALRWDREQAIKQQNKEINALKKKKARKA